MVEVRRHPLAVFLPQAVSGLFLINHKERTESMSGPAFPRAAGHNSWSQVANESVRFNGPQDGMSLRDYFAAQAMIGILASCQNAQPDIDVAAIAAYGYADAMLEARKDK